MPSLCQIAPARSLATLLRTMELVTVTGIAPSIAMPPPMLPLLLWISQLSTFRVPR